MGLKSWATTNNTVWTTSNGTIVTSLVDSDNPGGLRPYTIRFQFGDSSYNPTNETWVSGSQWVQVSSSPNVWDFTYSNSIWGNDYTSSPLYSRFSDRSNLVYVLGANLVGVTAVRYLFALNTALVSATNVDVSTAQDCYGMFYKCGALSSVSNINTASATDISVMFAYCVRLSSIPLFDTSHVVSFDRAFTECPITTAPLFNTSSARNMHMMFASCTLLNTVPLYDMSNVIYAPSMFLNCEALTSIPQLDFSSIENMERIFDGCHSLSSVPQLDCSNAIDMGSAFRSCSSLPNVPIYNTRHVTNFEYCFSGCTAITSSIPLLQTANTENCRGMFTNCYKVESGALALYQQMSTQVIPPAYYQTCFSNCGVETVTGAAELAQIPISWGGTMA